MKGLTAAVVLSSLFAMSGSWALPRCQGSYNQDSWTNCHGTLTYFDGDKYVGEWRNGKWHGQGTYTYANGAKYVGQYKDDKRHGQGTMTYFKYARS